MNVCSVQNYMGNREEVKYNYKFASVFILRYIEIGIRKINQSFKNFDVLHFGGLLIAWM